MLPTTTLERVIVDISLNEICCVSDLGDIKYITWDDVDNFMYIWRLLQTIKNHTEIIYVYSSKYSVRR